MGALGTRVPEAESEVELYVAKDAGVAAGAVVEEVEAAVSLGRWRGIR